VHATPKAIMCQNILRAKGYRLMGINATNACIWQKKNTDVSIRTTSYKYVQTNEQKS